MQERKRLTCFLNSNLTHITIMSEEQTQAPAQEEVDPRPGYQRIETGSTKHPDAKESEDGKVTAVIGVYVGGSIAEAVDKYGEEFVFENYVRNLVVAAQGKVRRALDQGVPVSKVEDEFDDLDPTEKSSGIADPQVAAMRAYQRMSDEEKAKFLAMFNQ